MQRDESFVDGRSWSTGRHFEPFFRDHFRSKWSQRAVKVIAIVVVVGLIAFGLGWGVGKASAAPVQGSQPHARECVDPQQDPCPPPDTFALNKFKNGKMGNANHATPWFFTNDAEVKEVIKNKIERKLGRIAARNPSRAARMESAQTYVNRLWSSADCDGQGSYNPYAWGFDVCNFAGPSPLSTKQQVQQSGALVLCGAGVAFAWADGAGVYVLGLMGTTCAWSFWLGLG
jgi:hypothetical protein